MHEEVGATMMRMPLPRWTGWPSLLVIPGLLFGGRAAAQHAEGVVREVGGTRMADAYVALLDEDQELVSATLTREDGTFTITAPGDGRYWMRISRIGYETLFDGPYTITDRDPLEVSVVMHPAPLAIDSLRISVEGRVARLTAVGYYERKDAGFGHFIEREEILRRSPHHLVEMLRGIPRVYVPELPPGGLNPPLLLNLGGSGFCSPTLYLDGVVAHQGGAGAGRGVVRPDDMVDPQDVEAVELYTGPSTVPLQFQSLSECGVVMIWTRHTPLRG